jgi:hypothetical protein
LDLQSLGVAQSVCIFLSNLKIIVDAPLKFSIVIIVMNIPSIKPVRSIALDNIFTGKKTNTRRGLSPFKSKLDYITGASRPDFSVPANPLEKNRFTFVRRNKEGYHAVGVGQIPARNFEEVKNTLRERGYNGVRMGGLQFKL